MALLAALCLLAQDAAAETSAAPLVQALERAHGDGAPYRNAVYLLLRVAGVGWIAAEWVAVIVLYKAYRLLQTAVARREGAA